MSCLPHPHSSPDPKPFAPSLKRKVVPEEDDIETQPTKKGISTGFRPKLLQVPASRNATASSSASTANRNPKPAAVMPRPPVATRPTSCSASIGLGALSSRVPSSKRITSGSAMAAAPDMITNLHKHLVMLESAHTQDKEQLVMVFKSAAASSSAAAVTTTNTSTADSAPHKGKKMH
ncbi:hypothetical protein K438DRAFT_1752530 [Mycena galopus ATCC 62051]|nr:hypothetical protein K438DRAFT_1752530 [Mycena galopus ATCC 62051]